MGSITTGVHHRQDTQGRGVVEGRASDSPAVTQVVSRTKQMETEELGTGTGMAQHSPDRNLGPQKVLTAESPREASPSSFSCSP